MAASVKMFGLQQKLFAFSKPLCVGVRLLHQSLVRYQDAPPLTLSVQEKGIKTITLNNPKKRNALSLAMLGCLKQSLEENADDPELRVIILKGEGPVFSAGHDLKEMTSKEGRAYHEEIFHKCTQVMSLVQDLPIPVIAQVRGLATAAGCQLVASADVAIASENARFATPGVSVGLFCSTPGIAVARSVPRKIAMEMLLTGHPISAQDALLHGLVSKVVPDDQLEEETMKIARRICETSKPVISLGKEFFYKQLTMERDAAYWEGEQVMVENLQLKDAQEGIKAFIEKRPAHWSHSDEKVE